MNLADVLIDEALCLGTWASAALEKVLKPTCVHGCVMQVRAQGVPGQLGVLLRLQVPHPGFLPAVGLRTLL